MAQTLQTSFEPADDRLGGQPERRDMSLRETALQSGPERQVLLASHPLHGDIIEIKTPPIKSALLAIQEAIKYRRPGLAFAADCRHGKTTMLTMVSKAMAEMFVKVPYAVFTAAKHDKATEKAVWTDVLLGFDVEATGTAIDRKKAVRGAILTACRAVEGDTFVLYIDEAQNWDSLEFNFLRDLMNELRHYFKRTVITVTVGDLKLKTVRDAIRILDKGLWSRFLRNVNEFRGIESIEDLQKFMQEYDSADNEYPRGSRVCYSEFFLPHAYANGWRLAQEAPALWRELQVVAELHHRPLDDVGMQWIADSILIFLTLQLASDEPVIKPEGKDWASAVTNSQFETTFL